jgi:hypothetical protein
LIAYSIIHSSYVVFLNGFVIVNYLYKEKDDILLQVTPVIIISLGGLILLFLILLIIFQIRYISINSTTSEELRKGNLMTPDYDLGSTSENCLSFRKEIFSYRNLAEYNNGAKKLLARNKTLAEVVFERKHKQNFLDSKNFDEKICDNNDKHDTETNYTEKSNNNLINDVKKVENETSINTGNIDIKQ